MISIIFITVSTAFLIFILALNFTTPEKKLEHKIEHRYSLKDPQFRREMSVLLGPTITAGNHITSLQNGKEIFPAMLEAIRKAQSTICFETYIYWSGDIGAKIADALVERAQAGIRVNVIIDWVGSLKMEPELIEKITQAGVKVRRFRPLRWYNLARMNNRTHRKLLVVDGKIAFTGGVGIADQWEGDAQDPEHWRDIHFRITGPVAAQFQAAFNDNWIKATGEVLNGENYFPQLPEATGEIDAHLFISSPAGGSESMQLMYLMAIAAAVKTIDLQAAYFVPDNLIIKALITASQRGVHIRIITPGKYIDSETVRLASKVNWGHLLQAGIQISEYQPTMIHNKMLIVDREMVSVGSTNFDLRSFQLNDEASLNLYNKHFAEQMTEVFENDLKNTRPYTLAMWKNRSLKEKLLEKFIWPIKSQL